MADIDNKKIAVSLRPCLTLFRTCLLVFFLSYLPAAAQAHEEKVPFVIALESQEVFPYYLGTKGIRAENPGAGIEMIQLLASMVPVNLAFVRLPLNRSFIAMAQGKADAMILSYKTARLQYGKYPMAGKGPDNTRAMDHANYCLYATEGSPVAWHPEKWTITGAAKPIGAPFGYSIAALLRQHQIKTDEYGNTRENLVKLAAGRLDGAALLEFDADRVLIRERQSFSQIVKLAPPLSTRHYFLVLSHKFHDAHPELSQQIWDACREIRITHRDRILARYLQLPR